MSFFSGLFGKSPAEQAKEWIRTLHREERQLEVQVNKIQREQQRVKISMKQAAKKEDSAALRILALELVRSKKAVSRLLAAKATMKSVSMELQHQMAQAKMAKSMAQSAEVMHCMNQLVKIPEVQANMRVLSKEMSKAGVIEEMMNDAVDSALDKDISDGDLEEEVQKVVDEVVTEQMKAGRVGTSKLLPSQKVEMEEVDRFEALEDDNGR